MKPVALAVALAVWIRCGAPPAEVRVHAVGMVDTTPIVMFTALYRADVRTQAITWRVEGVADTVTALQNCTVRDALNWRCEERDAGVPSGSVMVDGRYGRFGVVGSDDWKYLTEPEWTSLQAQRK